MDPITGTILGGIGLGLQFFGASKEAEAQKAQAMFQARQMRLNAAMAEFDARDAIKRGDLGANMARRKGAQIRSAQRAAMAAQGIEVDTGTAQAVVEDTEAAMIEDVVMIKNNAMREAFGLREQSIQMRQQADWTQRAGVAAANNTLLSGGARAISGAASLYNDYQSAISRSETSGEADNAFSTTLWTTSSRANKNSTSKK